MSRVFISHNHVDKQIARRIVRFLRNFGVDAWLDERELRIGSRLDDAIRQAILESDAVIVVATRAAATSKWVERELEVAVSASPAIDVCPVYVDDVTKEPIFAPHLGIQAQDRHEFVRVLEQIAESFVGSPLPEPDAKTLELGLEQQGATSSPLRLLIEGCLHGDGIRYEHVQLVSEVPFHDLDDTLDAISRLNPGAPAAHATAALFACSGVGRSALSRAISRGHAVLGSAVGGELGVEEIEPALKLLGEPNPPDDQSLYSFLRNNTAHLNQSHEAEIIRLVTHPHRGPSGFAADSAAAALALFPENSDLEILWLQWIWNGMFDDRSQSGSAGPQPFAHWSAQGLNAGSGTWQKIFDGFLGHLRKLARSKSEDDVHKAVHHMMKAADEGHPRLDDVVRTCTAAIGAAEWDGWEKRDEMSDWISAHATQALGDRHWSKAVQEAEKSSEIRAKMKEARRRDP